MILNRMEKRNNNVGDSLVLEFLNIWSDLKKFNSQETTLPNDESSLRYESITKARFNRQIDPRDDQQNLFAEYNGTYMVKRGKKLTKKEEYIPVRRQRLKRRRKDRIEGATGKSQVPDCSGALKNDNGNISRSSQDESSPESQKIVDIFNHLEDSPEVHLKDDPEVARHTHMLLSFLKSVHILPVLEEEDVEIDRASISTEDAVEKDTCLAPNPLTIPIVDDNNNCFNTPGPVIIDITDSSDTHSEEDIFEEEHKVKVSNECRWLNEIEEEEDFMKESLEMREYKHPLEHDWTFWYFFHQEDKTWSQSLEALVTVSTIEDFWSVINWVESPSSIKVGADFSMFKRGIIPDWSDKANQRGGRYIVRCHMGEVDTMWTELMMALIGQNFVDPENDDKINGSVVSIRRREPKLAIWVRSISDRDLVEQSVMAVLGRKGDFSIHKH